MDVLLDHAVDCENKVGYNKAQLLETGGIREVIVSNLLESPKFFLKLLLFMRRAKFLHHELLQLFPG